MVRNMKILKFRLVKKILYSGIIWVYRSIIKDAEFKTFPLFTDHQNLQILSIIINNRYNIYCHTFRIRMRSVSINICIFNPNGPKFLRILIQQETFPRILREQSDTLDSFAGIFI